MAGTISFLIIGILILESRICRGLDDTENANQWKTVLSSDITPCIYFSGSNTFPDIISWLEFLKVLDVQTIWLGSNFPWVEAGAVGNSTDMHSETESMVDFERLVDSAHKLDIRVIISVVPFETNASHPWFKKWSDNVSPYNDFYVTLAEKFENADDYHSDVARDYDLLNYQKGWSEKRDALYLLTSLNVPCLKLSNPDVRRQLNKDIIEFWLNKNIGGFVIEKLNQYVFTNDWLPPSSEDITVSNKDYLREIRKFVDDWTIEHNSSPKYLGAVTQQLANESWFDSYAGGHPLSFIYKIHDVPKVYTAASLKGYMESVLGSLSQAEINNQLIWSICTAGWRVHLQGFISVYSLAMLMPGKVRLHIEPSSFVEGSIVTWDSTVAHQVATLRERPVFKYGDWKIETLNDDAIFVLRRELPYDPIVYLVVLNVGRKRETVNLSKVFSDLREHLSIVVTSHIKDSRRYQHFFSSLIKKSEGSAPRFGHLVGRSRNGADGASVRWERSSRRRGVLVKQNTAM